MAVITAGTGRRSPASKWMMVRRLTSLADTSSIWVISRRARAARHWAGVMSTAVVVPGAKEKCNDAKNLLAGAVQCAHNMHIV